MSAPHFLSEPSAVKSCATRLGTSGQACSLYRVVEAVSIDGSGNRVVTQTGYDADGGVAFRVISATSPAGTALVRFYDDNGDGADEMRWAA